MGVSMRNPQRPSVVIDLARVRANCEDVARRCGVPVIAVVKADAYGLGAARVVAAIADVVEAFYVFDAAEAQAYEHLDIGKPTIALVGDSDDADDYISRRIRPAVWTAERAKLLARARPVLSVDTGQQRFACPPDEIDAVLAAKTCDEAFTHASTLAQARQLRELTGGRVAKLHAAGTSLLDEPEARLDAVRPGVALYRGAVRVTAPLLEAHDTRGPTGYTGFVSPTGRHGVIYAGYSTGLRRGGPCLVNGERRRIPEVGMQTAFVELGPGDEVGDEVVLLGDEVTEHDVAEAWRTTPQEALLRLCGAGTRSYVG
jgi:alanine racemase